MPHAPEPLEIEPEEVQDPFSRFAAIAIVVATLLGALVGYLEANASRNAELANVRAQGSMVRAMSGLVRANRSAQVDFGTFAQAEGELQQAANALQRRLFAGEAGEELALELAEERYRQLYGRTLQLTDLEPAGPAGPELDAAFPNRFFADSQREADRLWALADAANQEDAGWESQEANLTAVLTIFAVAVYLLGLSLTLAARVRLLLAGVGTALVLVGTAWAGWLALESPERSPPEAAAAFADARKAMLLATEEEGYREAERLFTRAIQLRPAFPQALAERAQATFRAGSPQIASFTSVSTPEALEASTDDLRRALDLGLDTRPVLGDLGFHAFLLGLQTDDPALLEESLAYTEAATEMDPSDPLLHYNRGVVLLAMGETEAARAAYREAARRTIYLDDEGTELRGNPALENEWVSGALTDLEILLAERPRLGETVKEIKELIVGTQSREEVGVGEATVGGTGLEVQLFSSKVQWEADLPGYDPETDVVSAQWYRRTQAGWVVMPEASGSVVPAGQEGAWFSLTATLPNTYPHRCLDDGTYRVELYVNGHLAGTGTSEHAFGDLEPTTVDDVNVAFCGPAAWKPYESEVEGLIEGAVAEDGSEGAYLFRLQTPERQYDDPVRESREWLDAMIDSFDSIFPAPPRPDVDAEVQFFLGLEGAAVEWYAYDGGSVIAGAGLSSDGAVIIGAVFGPDERFDEDLLRVFDSLVELRPL